MQFYANFLYSCFFHFSGRGVDLSRNWSVDWGKKEKVVFSAVYFMHRENCFLLTYCSVHVDFTELRLKLIT